MTTFRGIRNHSTAAFAAALPVAFAVAALGMPVASASPWEPEFAHQPAQVQTDDWPDEGSGYPGYGNPSPLETVPRDWPDEGTGYPGYGDQPAPTSTGANHRLDTTSVTLGALGGIALGGAGLGITLLVQRRRNHVVLPTA